jgi:hypothetical protein
MSRIITGNNTTEIELTDTANNPVYVQGTIKVAGASVALYGEGNAGSNSWTITIDSTGVVSAGTGSNDAFGIELGGAFAPADVGYIDNLSGGSIYGAADGIEIFGTSGTVVNASTIKAGNTGSKTGDFAVYMSLSGVGFVAGSVDNTATIAGYRAGVRILGAPAAVTNSGKIEQLASAGSFDGVYLGGGSATVVNSGLISAVESAAVYLNLKNLGGAGTVTNNAGGTLSGNAAGVWIAGGAGTVTNADTIEGTGTNSVGVALAKGGSVDNTAGLIEGRVDGIVLDTAATVTNSAVVMATATANADDGIDLAAGGSVTNNSGGRIEGGNGLYFSLSSVAVVVSNAGTITSTGTSLTAGIQDEAGGTIDNTGLIQGYDGIWARDTAATITNSGTVEGTLALGVGIDLSQGGSIDNTGGLIKGADGVFAFNVAATVTNAAMITGTGAGRGVQMSAGGYVTNVAGGLIQGAFGVEITGGSTGTVINAGTITGTTDVGVYMTDAYVNNSGMISGVSIGIQLQNGGTVVDSGAVDGSTSIYVGGAGNNLVEFENGYSLNSFVEGAAAANNTAELGGSVGAPVDVTYLDIGLTNFEDVLFGPGGNDTLTAVKFSGSLPFTISGFDQTTDMIHLTAVGANGTIAGLENDILTIVGSSGTVTLQLDASDPTQATDYSTVSDNDEGVYLVACFCRGTRILTEAGEVPVEGLVIGDRVVTRSGAARPIKWIGRRSYDGRFIAGNRAVLPVVVKAGALSDGVPARDLSISPHHALYLDDVLVPVEHLINGVSIVQQQAVDAVCYFHIELDTHDVILAEGAAVETFVDCDSRRVFHNAADYWAHYAEEKPAPPVFCAPRVEDGAKLEELWRRLARRAGAAPASDALIGYLDAADLGQVRGWARDAASPHLPVMIEILVDGVVVGETLANRYRPDLVAAGQGDGRHGFEFALPTPLPADSVHVIFTRRASDGTQLNNSPRTVDARNDSVPDTRSALGRLVADVKALAQRPQDLDPAIHFLLSRAAALIARRQQAA